MTPENLQTHILGSDEARRRIISNPAEPHPISRIDMYERAEHVVVGGSEIPRQFLRRKSARHGHKPVRCPLTVVQVCSQPTGIKSHAGHSLSLPPLLLRSSLFSSRPLPLDDIFEQT